MQVIFTIHSLDRIKKRKLTKEEVLEIIKYADLKIKKYDKIYSRKYTKQGIIEVVYEKTENYIRVITVYWM